MQGALKKCALWVQVPPLRPKHTEDKPSTSWNSEKKGSQAEEGAVEEVGRGRGGSESGRTQSTRQSSPDSSGWVALDGSPPSSGP